MTVYPRLGLSAPGALSHLDVTYGLDQTGDLEAKRSVPRTLTAYFPFQGVITYPRAVAQFLTLTAAYIFLRVFTVCNLLDFHSLSYIAYI